MIEFILNDKLIRSNVNTGMTLLDFIRHEKKLKGTKSACREGDCGSCTVFIGKLSGSSIEYKAVTSCITPVGNVHGKHVVTIEGLNMEKCSPVQQALIDAAAVQCGYCTPGFVVSLTSFVMTAQKFEFEVAKDAVAGNICRCTGYKSIERAIDLILNNLKSIDNNDRISWLVENEYLPPYFREIKSRLALVNPVDFSLSENKVVGGGTDLYVQRPDEMSEINPLLVSDESTLTQIEVQNNQFSIGGACKISDILHNEEIADRIPGFQKHIKLIASELIRNIATVAGNLVNASPIGDLSILFLALNADVELKSGNGIRRVKLNQFFKQYKVTELSANELVTALKFELPDGEFHFNFEKVSKRKYLDIASVNSAILLETKEELIENLHLSVGGVSAIPLYLTKTCQFMTGKMLDVNLLHEASAIMDSEISPISDVRGSADYKRLLARQLFYAHFIELFPEKFDLEKLIATVSQ